VAVGGSRTGVAVGAWRSGGAMMTTVNVADGRGGVGEAVGSRTVTVGGTVAVGGGVAVVVGEDVGVGVGVDSGRLDTMVVAASTYIVVAKRKRIVAISRAAAAALLKLSYQPQP